MRDEFLITQQGNQYVLFAGLLDEAHNNQENGGLHSIETILHQVPTKDNGLVAIVFAQVTMDTDADPQDRRKFSGIGDASPENVNGYKTKRLIAMAETRAKARALRDAVNVGATAFEEIGEADPDAAQVRQAKPQQQRRKSSPDDTTQRSNVHEMRGAAKDTKAPDPDKIRKSQADMIRVLWADLGGDDDSLKDWLKRTKNCGLKDLSRSQANDLIDKLSEKANAQAVDDESGLGETSRQTTREEGGPGDDIELDEDDIAEIESMS